MATDPKEIIRRAEELKSRRSNFESHWQEVRDYIIPVVKAFTGSESPGVKAHDKVVDSTGEQADELLANNLAGLLTDPASPWFDLRVGDAALNDDAKVGAWLENARNRMLAVFNSPRSNFANAMHELYLDVSSFGTAAMYLPDLPGRGIAFQSRPLSEILLAENADGIVDTWIRDFTLTARQAAQAFGQALGANVAKAAAEPRSQDQEFHFLHAVYPRADYGAARGRLGGARELPYASCWVCREDNNILKESGYHEPPFVTPRWYKRSGEVYGRGPGMKALADVKMLQRGARINLAGAELAMRPPLQVPDDGVLSPVRLTPGGLNMVRADVLAQGGGIKPLLTGARPDIGEELLQNARARIDAAFYGPILRQLRDPRATATQILELKNEMLRIMAPILGRLKSELLGPLIERVFAVMWRGGGFARPPDALSGANLGIEYVGPLAKAQHLAEARGIAQTMEIMAPLAAQDPTILDNVDVDLTFRHVADLLSWPKRTLRSLDAVQAIRQGRAEATQQQAAVTELIQGAGAAAKVVKALPDMAKMQPGAMPASAGPA